MNSVEEKRQEFLKAVQLTNEDKRVLDAYFKRENARGKNDGEFNQLIKEIREKNNGPDEEDITKFFA